MAPVHVGSTSISRRDARQSSSRSRSNPAKSAAAGCRNTEKPQSSSTYLLKDAVALQHDISRVQFANWTLARRRAWVKRFSDPSSYFYHYCHPKFDDRVGRWSIAEHGLFLAAIVRIPPIQKNWSAISLLVPGRTGSECRRYYHHIGRAGLITVRGTLRKRRLCRASICTFTEDGVKNGRLSSSNPLFRRNALRRYAPAVLPVVDDSMLKTFKAPHTSLTQEQIDACTYIPICEEHIDRKKLANKSLKSRHSTHKAVPQEMNVLIPCRLQLRSRLEHKSNDNVSPKEKKDLPNVKKKRGHALLETDHSRSGSKSKRSIHDLPELRTSASNPLPQNVSHQGGTVKKSAGFDGSSPFFPKCVDKATRGDKRSRGTYQKECHLGDEEQAITKERSSRNASSWAAKSVIGTPSSIRVSTEELRVSAQFHDSGTAVQSAHHGGDMNNLGSKSCPVSNVRDTALRQKNNSSPPNRSELECPNNAVSVAHHTSASELEDGDVVLDMDIASDSPCSSQRQEADMKGDEAHESFLHHNKKRVLGPSCSERNSIAYLMSDEGEPEKKQPRVMEKRSSVCVGDAQSRATGSRDQCEPRDKLNEMGLLLRLFVETVDETGKGLGHGVERYRLLQRYNEYVSWVRSGFRNGALFEAARLLRHAQGLVRCAQDRTQPVGCHKCLDDSLDSWRQQLNDMMERQKIELKCALKVAQVL